MEQGGMTEGARDRKRRPDLRVQTPLGGPATVTLTGAWNLRSIEPALAPLRARLAACGPDACWDLRSVAVLDHAGALLLWHAWGNRRTPQLQLRPEHESVFNNLGRLQAHEPLPPRRWRLPGELLLRQLLALGRHILAMTVLLGYVVLDVLQLLRRPAAIPWREISANVYRIGTQALGITALVGFLVGVVLSYLTAQQLRTFGADIYIVNLLGISVVRELGPVLAAILIAGRSGSAMTAQLGVMRVTQELDAMAVMGIPHTRRLILPRMAALALAMPLLVLWTDALALLGGMMAAQQQLGIDFRYFLAALPDAVPVANLWLGLGKGVVFGVLIALIACHYGLRVEPNTVSLGTGTTDSVVSSITMVIIVDAIFAIMFSDVGVF